MASSPGAAAAGSLAATSSLLSIKSAQGAEATIRMQLGWLASNGILGEVVAIKKGFYKEAGVTLEIVPGGPNVDGVAGVASGQSTLGQISSSPSVMLARSAGMPIKAIAAGYKKHPFAYFSRKGNPIASPKDMIGKTIATQPTAFILLRALLAKNGIAEDQVKMVNMGSDMNQLITGQADAVTGWVTNTNALKALGDDRVDLMLWDGGLQLYANVTTPTDDQLANHSDELTRFMGATAKGWGYARDNQEEAVNILVEAYPNMDKASELEAIGPLMKFAFNEGDGGKWLGRHGGRELGGADQVLCRSWPVQGHGACCQRRHEPLHPGGHDRNPQTGGMIAMSAGLAKQQLPMEQAFSEPAVSIRNLDIRFGSGASQFTALSKVSVDIPQGGFVTMLGPSGCGKSTLLRCVARSRADQRRIGLCQMVARRSRPARAATSPSFSRRRRFFPWRTAIENVRLPLEVGRHEPGITYADPEALLELGGAEGPRNALPEELSGGQRQRVAIALRW